VDAVRSTENLAILKCGPGSGCWNAVFPQREQIIISFFGQSVKSPVRFRSFSDFPSDSLGAITQHLPDIFGVTPKNKTAVGLGSMDTVR
jgi:hypothetical protein